MTHTLTHPELFDLAGPDGQVYRGPDQDWYRSVWQRRAGCGPTTSAALLGYLSKVHPALSSMAPARLKTAKAMLSYMESVWPYVTPGSRGLDQAENLVLGCRSFALSRGCCLQGEVLEVPRDKGARPTPEDCRAFLTRALDQDCPAAFLNYSSGKLDNLDNWHWVLLIAVTGRGDDLRGVILDGGEEKQVDLALWLATTSLGGAFAAVWPDT